MFSHRIKQHAQVDRIAQGAQVAQPFAAPPLEPTGDGGLPLPSECPSAFSFFFARRASRSSRAFRPARNGPPNWFSNRQGQVAFVKSHAVAAGTPSTTRANSAQPRDFSCML